MADYGSSINEVPASRPYEKDPGPTEAAANEPTLEDDLNLLDGQLGELQYLIEQIANTKRRIEGKNEHIGQRIGKSYEAYALITRGELAVDTRARF